MTAPADRRAVWAQERLSAAERCRYVHERLWNRSDAIRRVIEGDQPHLVAIERRHRPRRTVVNGGDSRYPELRGQKPVRRRWRASTLHIRLVDGNAYPRGSVPARRPVGLRVLRCARGRACPTSGRGALRSAPRGSGPTSPRWPRSRGSGGSVPGCGRCRGCCSGFARRRARAWPSDDRGAAGDQRIELVGSAVI